MENEFDQNEYNRNYWRTKKSPHGWDNWVTFSAYIDFFIYGTSEEAIPDAKKYYDSTEIFSTRKYIEKCIDENIYAGKLYGEGGERMEHINWNQLDVRVIDVMENQPTILFNIHLTYYTIELEELKKYNLVSILKDSKKRVEKNIYYIHVKSIIQKKEIESQKQKIVKYLKGQLNNSNIELSITNENN